MRNREIFKKIKNYVQTENLTREQVESTTVHQVASAIGKPKAQISPYFNGIKRLILEDMQEAKDLQRLSDIRGQIKNWLDMVYPDWEYTVHRENGKIGVTIWPFGKPEHS